MWKSIQNFLYINNMITKFYLYETLIDEDVDSSFRERTIYMDDDLDFNPLFSKIIGNGTLRDYLLN